MLAELNIRLTSQDFHHAQAHITCFCSHMKNIVAAVLLVIVIQFGMALRSVRVREQMLILVH